MINIFLTVFFRDAGVRLLRSSRFFIAYPEMALGARLAKDATPLGKARYHYYLINNGPWSDLDEHKAFVPNVPAAKLPGANFYPEDMTKAEFEAWVKKLLPAGSGKGDGFFTVIHRQETAASFSRNLPYNVV